MPCLPRCIIPLANSSITHQAVVSMYNVIMSKVRAGNGLTVSFMCSRGLKQGEMSRPVLFSLFKDESQMCVDFVCTSDLGAVLHKRKMAKCVFSYGSVWSSWGDPVWLIGRLELRQCLVV